MIIECHVRSDLSLPGVRPIKVLFQVFARYFNKNSKTTNQSDLRNNAKHVINGYNLKLRRFVSTSKVGHLMIGDKGVRDTKKDKSFTDV